MSERLRESVFLDATAVSFQEHRSLDTDNQVIADDEGTGRGRRASSSHIEFQLSDINPSRYTYRGRKREETEMIDVGAF